MNEPTESLLSPSVVDEEQNTTANVVSNINEITFTELIHFSDDDEPIAQEIALPESSDVNHGIPDYIDRNDADVDALKVTDFDRMVSIETTAEEPSPTLPTDHFDISNDHKELPEDNTERLFKTEVVSHLNSDQDGSPGVVCHQLVELPETSLFDNSPGTHQESDRSINENQISLLRKIVCEVGSALSKRFDAAADFILPESLDEASTSELILELKSLVGQLSKESSSVPQPVASIIPPESEWVEVNEWQPTPDYGLDSPVITHLLSNWTNDNAKIDFLRSWVRSLYMPSYEAQNYPPGLQITNLTCVLRDGFMVLLIPLIRSLSKPPITVHVKKHSRAPIPVPVPVPRTVAAGASGGEASAPDTFAQDDFLYDIRVKRLDVTLSTEAGGSTAESARASTGTGASVYAQGANAEGYVSDQVAAHNFHQQRAGLKHRVDSQSYYSPLAEINSFLPVIEAKTKRSTDGPAGAAHSSRRSFSEEPHVVPGTSLGAALAPAPAPSAPAPIIPSYTLYAPTPAPNASSAEASAAATVAATQDAASVVPATRPAATAPAPSLLQSIFSWWEPAPATAAAPSAAPAGNAEAQSDEDQTAINTTTSTAGLQTEPGAASAAAVASTAVALRSREETTNEVADTTVPAPAPVLAPAPAAPAVNPVNKIAERLQQMRALKQQQQQPGKQAAGST